MDGPDRFGWQRELNKVGESLPSFQASSLSNMALLSTVRPQLHPGILGFGYQLPPLSLPNSTLAADSAAAVTAAATAATFSEERPIDLSVKVKADPDAPLDLTVTRKSLNPQSHSHDKTTAIKSASTQSPYPYHAVNPNVAAAAALLSLPSRASDVFERGFPNTPMPNRPSSVGSTNTNTLQCTKCSYTASSLVDFQHHFYVTHHRVPSPNPSKIATLPSKRAYDVPGPHSTPPINASKYADSNDSTRYHCPFCAWQCDVSQNEAFNNHMNKHYTNARYCTYTCAYCSRDFAEPSSLREHIAMHPLMNQFVCAICNLAFSSRDLFNQHMRKKHIALPQLSPQYNRSPSARSDSQQYAEEGRLIARPQLSHQTSMNSEERAQSISSVQSPPPASSQGAMSSRLSDRTSDTPLTVLSDSPSSSPTPAKRPRQNIITTTLGQTIAKEIQAAISKELIDVKEPTVSDLLFMKGPDPSKIDGNKKPLNLMSLLDRVVEQSLRSVPSNSRKPEKPDLKFMVTFSDGEEDVVECDSTAATAGPQGNDEKRVSTDTKQSAAGGQKSPSADREKPGAVRTDSAGRSQEGNDEEVSSSCLTKKSDAAESKSITSASEASSPAADQNKKVSCDAGHKTSHDISTD